MSFAKSLERLQAELSTAPQGRCSPAYCQVQRKDLEALLRDWERLDCAARHRQDMEQSALNLREQLEKFGIATGTINIGGALITSGLKPEGL